MKITFTYKKKEGTITCLDSQTVIEFPDDKIKETLEEYLNTMQEIKYSSMDLEGNPRMTVSNAVPASDDGMLVYCLQGKIPGIRKKIIITGITGSDKVTFRG